MTNTQSLILGKALCGPKGAGQGPRERTFKLGNGGSLRQSREVTSSDDFPWGVVFILSKSGLEEGS